MDVAAAAVHVPAMHFSLPASSRLHPLRLLPTGASSSLLTSTCAAISRGLPVHHGLGRTAVLVGRRVFPRFWSVVITNPKDPFLAARNLGSTAAVASASGAASSASGSRNANVVRRWRPSTVVAGGEFLLRCMRGFSAAKSQRSGEREEDPLHASSQEKKREGYSKADKAARSNSVTAAAGKGGGAFNKFRTKYQASGIGQTKSYSSSTCSTQQRSSGGGRRTYVSGSKFLSSVTLQETVSKSRLAQEHEEKMQNGGDSRKRTGPNMKPGVMEEPKALELYDKVVAEGALSFNQYSFNIVLYLCSSAASGVLKRGKSGNERSQQGDGKELIGDQNAEEVVVLSDDQKALCLKRGFEIYEVMKLQGVPPNEATFTAVARLAVAKGDGDLAFDMVKQLAEAKITPRLRSYGPALYTYCKMKVVDKAFEVDEHMRAAGVQPEEAEWEALLKLSVEMGLEEKVYSLLHRLRTTVREFSASTVGVVEQWFTSSAAENAGKSKWANLPGTDLVKEAVQRGGGGWHGLGWLGKGSREAWLDRHGPFDAIVDAANVGLYNQNFGDGGFNFFQLNAVVNGIQKKIGSKREPLVLLHHRRTKGGAAATPNALSLLNRWQIANCIYTTPTGSNDDWYWLYAAVRYKCLLITNDEMRDHLFQLLGNEFFPKWKERHQVRFTLNRKDPVFHMPPPYSIVIQESETGSWHIPKSGGDDITTPREWLCVTRTGQVGLKTLQSEQASESLNSRPKVDSEFGPVSLTCSAQKVEVPELEEQRTSSKGICPPRDPNLLQSFKSLDSEVVQESLNTKPEVEDEYKPEDPEPSSRKKVRSPRRSFVSEPLESSSRKSELDEVCLPVGLISPPLEVEVKEPEEQPSPKKVRSPRKSRATKLSESSRPELVEECRPGGLISSAEKGKVREPEEQSPSPTKVRSTRRSSSPNSSTILQKLKTAERTYARGECNL
ncbi:unnamed protein product [Sphagnum jensenii]|uniref:Mitochondrial ribonuclease P catalytic subunit n=1 Tax=Sphagnum jensenii TaxID=128206 RepID=A0ABP0WHB5_9BRYO